MSTRVVKSVLVACLSFALSAPLISTAQVVDAGTRGEISADGIVKIKSVYTMDETIARVKQDIASKGIIFSSRSIKPSWLQTRASRCVRQRS